MYFSFSVVFIAIFFAETGEATAGVCEPIVANTCRGSGVFHRYTSTPIEVPYGPGSEDHDHFLTQQDAVRKFREYQPLMKSGRGCHEFLRPLICAVFLPSCDEFDEKTAIPPCRDLCEMALTKCVRGLRHRGLDWPPQLDCARFPAATENNRCISALSLGVPSVFSEEGQVEMQVGCTSGLLPELQPRWLAPNGSEILENETNRVFSRTDKHTSTLTIRQYTDSSDGGNYTCFIGNKDFSRKIPLDYIHEQPKDPGSCEPIQDSSFCKNMVGYTHTQLPNGFGMFSQSEVYDMLQRFAPVVMTDCSPYIGTLICGLALPRCNASSTNKFGVCQEVCLRVQADCTEIFEATSTQPLPCDEDLESEAEGDCYNGVEIGPVSVVDALDSATVKRVEVECRHAFNFNPTWITPTATLKKSVTQQIDHIEVASSDDGTVFRLIIHNFIDSRDAGIYTCSDGDTYSRSVTIDNINQPSREVEIGDLRVVGSDYSIDCTYNLYPALQPKWLSPRGREISTDPSARIRVVHTEATSTTLYIGDFQSATDGGLYNCFGKDFNSGQTVLIDSQEIHVNVTERPERPVDHPSCEEIRIPACSVGIGYSSTYVPNPIGLSQNDTDIIFDAMKIIFENTCSSYFRPYMCSLYLPPCREQAVPPCQEMCTKALRPCVATLRKFLPPGEVDKMLESCTHLPSSEDASSQCHNVLEVEIGEPQIVGPDYAVDCTYNLLPSLQPTWLSAGGEEIPTDSNSRIRVVHTSESVTTLYFKDFHRVVDGGRYSCFGQDLASAETIVIGDLWENTTLPTVEVPEQSSCEEIRVPACTVGIGYSSTYVPSLVGLSQDKLGSIFNGLDVIFEQPCSSYFRPYMCALYVPPCRERAVLPCQELCITAVEECAATLGNSFAAEEVASMRESCTSMPSETDPNSECHNVEELVLGGLKMDGFDYSVECTYNLLPAIRPKWRFPDGREVSAASWTRVRKVQVSDAVTRLLINDFSPATDSGTYTCVAGEHRITVDL